MKILFVGSLISEESMDHLNKIGKIKASAAPNNYETMLIKGLVENGADVEVISLPAMATYPKNPIFFSKKKNENLPIGVCSNWIPFINLQVVKQASIQWYVHRYIKHWLKENESVKDKIVMSYSIYPPYTKPAITLTKKAKCHISAVITDLPEYMYTWDKSSPFKRIFGNLMKYKMVKLQELCDSYVLFTEPMAKRMKIANKPYIVSEGFYDSSVFRKIQDNGKYKRKTITYAGNLGNIYGIKTLVQGFMKTNGDYELHLYGSGTEVDYIKSCVENDSRIKFFGRVKREEVLQALKKSHLIVINKPTSDDYSNYSFSSKILECVASGTPILTTRVGGMPTEYYDYFYFIDDETPEGISHALEKTLANEYELIDMGIKAKDFAKREKNYSSMTKKIYEFLLNTLGDK